MSHQIKYIKGSLFDAPSDCTLVHACNAQGVWGSGIAKEFKERYPEIYKMYHSHCIANKECNSILGTAFITQSVGCLITSSNYGNNVDKPSEIIINTTLALNNLSKRYNKKYASNKFNSGLFNIPWEETEKILAYFVKRYKIDWSVYVQD